MQPDGGGGRRSGFEEEGLALEVGKSRSRDSEPEEEDEAEAGDREAVARWGVGIRSSERRRRREGMEA